MGSRQRREGITLATPLGPVLDVRGRRKRLEEQSEVPSGGQDALGTGENTGLASVPARARLTVTRLQGSLWGRKSSKENGRVSGELRGKGHCLVNTFIDFIPVIFKQRADSVS